MEFKKDDWVQVLTGYNKGFKGYLVKMIKGNYWAIVNGASTVFAKPDNIYLVEKLEKLEII